MRAARATTATENGYPTSGLTVTPGYVERAGFRHGTFETGFVRFGLDLSGQAWFVVDKPRHGSSSGRSVHLTEEIAREMRDTLNALLEEY